MSKRKYIYFFPDQREIKEDINNSDIPLIANVAGYKDDTIKKMLLGWRKMPENVREICLKIAEINKQKKNLKFA